MNKTYLIVGGASVASLAVGATSGYFFAQKKFNGTLDDLVRVEIEATKAHYEAILAELKQIDEPVVEEASSDEYAPENEEDLIDEVTGEDLLEKPASKALTDYRGLGSTKILTEEKPDLGGLVENNIFANPKPVRPPRGPNGQFLPRQHGVETEEQVPDPYRISDEDFLRNDREFEQENIKYFRQDNALVDYANEDIPIEHVGAMNLLEFPKETPSDVPIIICVRNEGLGVDYEITLTDESLTQHMGLGDDDGSIGEWNEEDEDEDASVLEEGSLHYQQT